MFPRGYIRILGRRFVDRNVFLQRLPLKHHRLFSVGVNDEVKQYKEDGVICLRSCFSKHWVDVVKNGINKVLDKPSQYSEKISGGGNGVYFNDYLQWRNIPEFCDFIRHSPAPEIAAKFMEEEEVAFYFDHVFVKESYNESATPWHHDQSYFPVDGWQNCSLWIPVTKVQAHMGMRFVKGSHNWGKWFQPRYFKSGVGYVEQNSDAKEYEVLSEIDEEKYDILAWDMEPGDCLVFHMRTVHGSLANQSSFNSRLTLVTRWLGSDATLARRPWDTSPLDLTTDITFGDLMKNSEMYPVYSTVKKQYINF